MVAIDGPLATLLDTSQQLGDRVAAAKRLEHEENLAVIEALVRVAQQLDVPPELGEAAGRTLGRLCFARARDVHEVDLAMFSDEAGEAYDQEIGRLQRLHPEVIMRSAV